MDTPEENSNVDQTKQTITPTERAKLRLAPLIKGGEVHKTGNAFIDSLNNIYHRSAGVLEYIGYPSPKRHKDYIIKEITAVDKVKSESDKKEKFRMLMLGAMSPSSIADMLEILADSGIKGSELTVIDLSRMSLSSGKEDLTKIAQRLGINLNLVQANANDLPFKKETFDTVISDQLYNFFQPKDWVKITENILDYTKENGKFLNIIATYREKLPYFGKLAKGCIQSLSDHFPNHKLDTFSKYQLSYVGLTGIINDQFKSVA